MDDVPDHQSVDLTGDGVAIGGVDDVVQDRSHEIARRAADDGPGGGVDPQEQTAGVHHGHAQRRLVEGEVGASPGIGIGIGIDVGSAAARRARREEGFPTHRPRTSIETPPLGRDRPCLQRP